MSSPLAGAWQLESDTHQGLVVMTDTHYSAVGMPKSRQRSDSSEPTPEEAMAAYRGVQALAGTYTVSGSTATFQRLANLQADLIGEELVWEFSIEGDKLTRRTKSGASGALAGAELTFRKVS